MTREQMEAALSRTPFLPLTLRTTDGRKFDVPFRSVIVLHGRSYFLLFKGVKAADSPVATGYEHLQYDQVERLDEKRPPAKRRRKAS